MNVVLTNGADGSVTVHRDSCKKIIDREKRTIEQQIAVDPRKLVTPKKASCCKPTDAAVEDVEQAGWDALEAATNDEATDAPEVEADEDLIGEVEPAKPAVKKVAAKVAKEAAAKKEINGSEALKKVAEYLEIDLGAKPVFPGFGRAFKTTAKQSVYINSKGSADARATDTAQADAWAKLAHVERRAGNYVRVSLDKI